MSPARRPLVAALFVLTEALAWFIALRALGSVMQRERLADLERAVASAVQRDGADAEGMAALARLADGANGVHAGPPLLAVVLAAVLAFALASWIARSGLPSGLAAFVGLALSLLALHMLIAFGLSGDLAFWQQTSFGGLLGDDGIRERITPEVFLASGEVAAAGNAAASLTAAGLALLWVRFLVAGRRPLSFEAVLFSFSAGFTAVLGATVLAEVAGVGSTAIFALPYFVLGALTLAAAQAARAPAGEDLGRSGPWAASVAATLGAMAAVAGLFGLLGLLDAQRAFGYVADVTGDIVGAIAIAILTPIFFVMQWLGELVVDDANRFRIEVGEPGPMDTPSDDDTTRIVLPGWAGDVLRAMALALVLWGLYRASRMLFTRLRRSSERGYEEERSSEPGEGDAGVGALLRRLVPRARRRGSPAWLALHPAYRLFARAVALSEDRGRIRRPGETPLEFGNAAAAALQAPPFTPIAVAFDRVRYGRHAVDAAEVGRLDAALTSWEQAHPSTETPNPRADVARSEGGPYADGQ